MSPLIVLTAALVLGGASGAATTADARRGAEHTSRQRGDEPVASTERVVETNALGHLIESSSRLGTPARKWVTTDLTVVAGATKAAGAPFSFATAKHGVVRHVIFRGAFGQVHEVWHRDGITWRHRRLASPQAEGDPQGWAQGATHSWITYRGQRGRIVVLRASSDAPPSLETPTRWVVSTASVPELASIARSEPWGFAVIDKGVSESRIIYVDGRGRLALLSTVNGAAWRYEDLSSFDASDSAGGAQPLPPIVGNPMGYYSRSSRSLRIVYRTRDGHIHQLVLRGASRTHTDVTTSSLGATAGGDPFGFADGRQERIVYRGEAGELNEFVYSQTRGWSFRRVSGWQFETDPVVYTTTGRGETRLHVLVRHSRDHLVRDLWVRSNRKDWRLDDVRGAPGLGRPSGYVTSNPDDSVAPRIRLVAVPAQVWGERMLTASASDGVGVRRVEYLLDGRALGTATTPPWWGVTWNTLAFDDGSHELAAVAYDLAGNSGRDVQTVRIENRPTITIASPAPNSTVSGVLRVDVEFFDHVGLRDVSVQLGDSRPPVVRETPLGATRWTTQFLLDTTDRPEGPQTLNVTARNLQALDTTASLQVQVKNDTTPPRVTGMATNGSVLSGIATFSADVEDNVGVASLEFTLNSVDRPAQVVARIGVVPAPPYRLTWNTLRAANGRYLVVATATDASGNSSSAGLGVSIDNTAASLTISLRLPAYAGVLCESATITWSITPVAGGLEPTGAGSTAAYTWTRQEDGDKRFESVNGVLDQWCEYGEAVGFGGASPPPVPPAVRPGKWTVGAAISQKPRVSAEFQLLPGLNTAVLRSA